MSRSDQRRRRALRAAAPVAGLLAVGLLVWQGSTAAFSATTDNGSENWATGSLTLTNDGGTGTYAASTTAVFNETALKIPTADRSLQVRQRQGRRHRPAATLKLLPRRHQRHEQRHAGSADLPDRQGQMP